MTELDYLLESIGAELDGIKTDEIDALLGESTGSFDELFEESKTDSKGSFDFLFETTSSKGAFDELFTEANTQKFDKKTQLKKQVSMAAIQIAKEEAPQVYNKYKLAQAKKVQLEELMIKKYKTQALARVKAANRG